MSAFSKVNLDSLLEDEEDEDDRRRIWARGVAKFDQAKDFYSSGGSQEKALDIFNEADRIFQPMMRNGLMSLPAPDLEVVLKCRLHQAAITAMVEHLPDRWPKVKAWCQDVLQFDTANCHAHWLLAHALHNGELGAKPGEVENHMLRAIEYARATSKTGEADRWQVEYERYKNEGVGFKGDLPPAAAASAVAAEPEAPEAPKEAQNSGGRATAEAAESGAAAAVATKPSKTSKTGKEAGKAGLQRGFFDKGPKPAAAAVAVPPPPAERLADGAAARSASGEQVARAAALAEEQRRQLAEQQAALDELRQQLEESRRREQEARDEADRSRAAVDRRLRDVAQEVTACLAAESEAAASAPHGAQLSSLQEEVAVVASSLRRAQTTASAARDLQASAREWAEAQHQRFVELSTEVLTLKDMNTREHQERQESSRQQQTGVRDLTRRFGELKGQVKTLRDHFRLKASAGSRGDQEEHDFQQLAEHAADFRRLPFTTKLAALANDGLALQAAGLAFVLGALLMVALFVEGFSRRRCAFACTG